MSRRAIVVQTVLPLPPDAAYAYVADPLHDPEWCKAVPWCRHEGGDPLAVGATYTFAEGWRREVPTDEGTITIESTDPPREIRYRARTRDRDYVIAYQFEEVPGGTRLTQRTIPSFRGKADRLVWLFRPVIRLQYRRQFRDLGRVLEGKTPEWRDQSGGAD